MWIGGFAGLTSLLIERSDYMNKKPPRRFKTILGSEDSLRKLALLYQDCEPVLYSDKYHYETVGRTKRGYKIEKLVNDGPITHIRIRITSKDWDLLVKSLNLVRNYKNGKTWRLE
jgi:hypothetical protein